MFPHGTPALWCLAVHNHSWFPDVLYEHLTHLSIVRCPQMYILGLLRSCIALELKDFLPQTASQDRTSGTSLGSSLPPPLRPQLRSGVGKEVVAYEMYRYITPLLFYPTLLSRQGPHLPKALKLQRRLHRHWLETRRC
ncbi:hypothetical protein C8Q74DRAFT_107625 [Fomes fomentarius]|nr:hypothetical protein C8Q74DRAFT_107625 [Fomes fomentarius]